MLRTWRPSVPVSFASRAILLPVTVMLNSSASLVLFSSLVTAPLSSASVALAAARSYLVPSSATSFLLVASKVNLTEVEVPSSKPMLNSRVWPSSESAAMAAKAAFISNLALLPKDLVLFTPMMSTLLTAALASREPSSSLMPLKLELSAIRLISDLSCSNSLVMASRSTSS